MIRKSIFFLFSILPVFAPVIAPAWEQTYPRGPVRMAPPSDPNKIRSGAEIGLRTLGPSTPNLSKSLGENLGQPNISSVLSVRTVTYPSQHGASVGMGWDFLINQKNTIRALLLIKSKKTNIKQRI